MGSLGAFGLRWVRVALVIGSLGCGIEAHAAATTLRWKVQPGETLRYESAQTTTSKVKDPSGQEMDQTLTLTMDLTWKVKAVDPQGVATLAQTIDRIRTSATLPFGKFSYDSRESGDAKGPAGPLFKMLVNAEFTFKMNPLGEISDIQLAESLTNALRSGKETAGAQGQFSEAGLKNMLVQMGLSFPVDPTDTGKTWSRKVAIPAGPQGETRDIEQVYTYQGTDPGGKPLDVVEMVTKFQPVTPDPNVPIKLKVQEATGRFLFDNQTGRIASSRVVEKVELTGQIQGKDIAQSNETVTVMTLQPAPTP